MSTDRILKLISFVREHSVDFAFNHAPVLDSKHLDGLGAEYISSGLFDDMYKYALKEQREHITKYFYDNKDKYYWKSAPMGLDDILAPNLKLDIDTYADYIFVANFISSGRITLELTDLEMINAYSILWEY